MKKLKKIARQNIPHNFPVVSTTVAWLLLDRLDASGIVWGIVGTIFAIWWVLTILDIGYSDSVDLLGG